MKKIAQHISILIVTAGLLAGCHKIDVPVTTALTPDVFPQTDAQFIQETGPVYVAFRGNFALDYWFMQTLSTDEAILPARGGNWYDNKGYMSTHLHDWTRDHGWTNSCWSWLSTVIGAANQAMSIIGVNQPASNAKQTTLAELRTMRAISYYMMMDLYGNVPIDTLFGDNATKTNVPRAQVFSFIESEVKAALPYLSRLAGVATYGRPNKFTAYSLLAKMYLNAEYYTGTQRYSDCVVACDSVMNSNLYTIETRANYLKMFYPNNGPATKEFIFAIPYDPAATNGYLPVNGFMYRARYDVPRSMRARFSLPFTPSAPESTLPEFYAHFNDPNDIRNGQWLTGLQFNYNGTPVRVSTTKKGYDQFYTGADKDSPFVYQVNLTPDIIFRQNASLYDCGNDEIAWNMGYRNIKFYPDSTSTSRNQNNDVPVFRYSDILLMKAEAILRGGTPTQGHTAASLVNMVRSNRTTSAAWATVTLEQLYEERCREMAMETWHRNDMIRFGKYEEKWGFKTDADINHRIFPIPMGAIRLNPALKQNIGYN